MSAYRFSGIFVTPFREKHVNVRSAALGLLLLMPMTSVLSADESPGSAGAAAAVAESMPAATEPGPSTTPTAAALQDKMICRREAQTGSRLGRRNCRTQTEADAAAQDAQKAIRENSQ